MMTIREYADSQAVSYEAVRKQVRLYKKELKSHITVKNNTQMLDDYACDFLNEHRRPKTIVQTYSSEDLKKQIEALKADLDEAKDRIMVLQDEKDRLKDIQLSLTERNSMLLEEKARTDTLLLLADKEHDELAETRQKLEDTNNELSQYVPSWFGLYKKLKN